MVSSRNSCVGSASKAGRSLCRGARGVLRRVLLSIRSRLDILDRGHCSWIGNRVGPPPPPPCQGGEKSESCRSPLFLQWNHGPLFRSASCAGLRAVATSLWPAASTASASARPEPRGTAGNQPDL